MVAHANSTSFLGSNVKTKGEYKAFRIGGVLKTLEWKLRMKVDFHHKFVVNEQTSVNDSPDLKLYKLTLK